MGRFYRVDVMLDDREEGAAPPSSDANDFVVGMMQWFGDVDFKGWWRDEAGALWRRFEFPRLQADDSDDGNAEYREVVDALGALARLRGENGLACVDIVNDKAVELRPGQASEFSLSYYELPPDGVPRWVPPDAAVGFFPNEASRSQNLRAAGMAR